MKRKIFPVLWMAGLALLAGSLISQDARLAVLAAILVLSKDAAELLLRG